MEKELTQREKETMKNLIKQGYSHKAVAKMLKVTEDQVKKAVLEDN